MLTTEVAQGEEETEDDSEKTETVDQIPSEFGDIVEDAVDRVDQGYCSKEDQHEQGLPEGVEELLPKQCNPIP